MEQLIEIFRRLLELTDTSYVRYLHKQIAWSARMIGIVGARGVGKTTLLLQHIKLYLSPSDTLFVNADDIYFAEHKLIDLVSTFYKRGGKHIFIDEVHKYANWSKELKMMYDYYPDLQIVFTGSSILDIYKGNADLSRRALNYFLPGLSFREYLILAKGIKLPAYTFEDILANKVQFPAGERPLPLFQEYLQKGYYPFFRDPDYAQRLRNIIHLTINSERNPILIGTGGKTLQAFNELTRLAVSAHFKHRYRVLLDVGGYKEERYEKVARIARREAKSVQKTKGSAKLNPMTPDERRIVHNALNGMPHITTESEGEGGNRAVVIKYVD